jgi:hypothetical protein
MLLVIKPMNVYQGIANLQILSQNPISDFINLKIKHQYHIKAY